MSDEKPGDPRTVRHLRPTRTPVRHPSVLPDEYPPAPQDDPITPEEILEMEQRLSKLREPFPPEMVEKLPKPTFKGAWDGKRGGKCNVCHGYHVLENCIHLDYVGHANVTNRLLEVDPFWEWEPMAYTAEGTPYFSDGGLWIKLTVCGMTRIGYGDGKNVKEVIGDAIRNAAMRFGVALDLWSKIDLHAERNPGDGEASRSSRAKTNRGVSGSASQSGGGAKPKGRDSGGAGDSRAANQDALDSLLSVCQEYKLKPADVEKRFQDEHPWGIALVTADSEEIMEFAAKLIAEATADPDGGGHVGAADDSGVDDPLSDSARPAESDDLF